MSYNGSGTFVINTAGQPVVSGTVISSTAFNALTADLATGLSTAITKDGQTTPTANIPMGNNKITGLAVGTAATDAANLSQVQSTTAKLVNSISGADTITGTMSPNLAAYATGQMFYFIAAGDNTGAVTLNIDSLGAKAVTRDGSVALAAGDIKSGEVVVVVYDGTRFQVVSQLNSAGDARFANVSITSALNVGGVATFTGGTANGVTYLNGSKALTSGTALTFDGSNALGFGTGGTGNTNAVFTLKGSSATDYGVGILATRNSANSWLISNAGLALGGGAAGVVYYNYVNNDPWIWYDGANSAERLRLTGNGNLGLGVTPSAWNSAFNVFEFGAKGNAVYTHTSNYNVNLSSNAYYDSAGYKYGNTAAASYYNQYNGIHSWYTAPSGTAGNTITFTQAMTLDASGRLGLGATSPTYSVDVQNQISSDVLVRIKNTNASEDVGLIIEGVSSTAKEYKIGINTIANAPDLTFSGPDGYRWYSGGTERARITAAGELCVGATSALTALTVEKGANNATNGLSLANNNEGEGYGSAVSFYGAFGAPSATNQLIARINGFVTGPTSTKGGILAFSTGTGGTVSERARITSGGVYLVGTTNTAGSAGVGVKLHPDGLVATVSTTSISDSYNYYSETAGAYRFYVTNGGTIFATNTTISAISDQRLKENIRDLDAGLDAVMALKPRKFDWKEGKGQDKKNVRGFIAQEFEQVFPDLIDTWKDPAPEGEEPYKSVRQDLIPVLVKAIQELKAELDAAKVKIAGLEAK